MGFPVGDFRIECLAVRDVDGRRQELLVGDPRDVGHAGAERQKPFATHVALDIAELVPECLAHLVVAQLCVAVIGVIGFESVFDRGLRWLCVIPQERLEGLGHLFGRARRFRRQPFDTGLRPQLVPRINRRTADLYGVIRPVVRKNQRFGHQPEAFPARIDQERSGHKDGLLFDAQPGAARGSRLDRGKGCPFLLRADEIRD